MSKSLPRIAITMGDPGGVGPEICLRLLQETSAERDCVPIVFGNASVLRRVAAKCSIPFFVDVLSSSDAGLDLKSVDRPCVLDLHPLNADSIEPGKISAAAGAAAFDFIKTAIDAALSKQVDAITTAPINKESLHAAGIAFPGHTEILESLTKAPRICMMLTSDEITCSLVTAHVGLREVPDMLNVPRIIDTIELTAEAMRRLRNREPRLAICGLNPHAGESGLFGAREEERFIIPALEAVRQRGIQIEGPFPPDTAFLPQRRRQFDAYVCMYHDQGLIPLKMLSFDTGINITLGLPIIRTSVDHGTAFDIAWQGTASHRSLVEATKLAARLAGGSS